MPEISHDIDALTKLKDAMAGIYIDILEPRKDEFEFSPLDAGHSAAADAIGSFWDGWQDGRRKVSESLYERIQGLKEAIQRYEEQELALSDGFGVS